jgi:flagellar biogenesis protein FliO
VNVANSAKAGNLRASVSTPPSSQSISSTSSSTATGSGTAARPLTQARGGAGGEEPPPPRQRAGERNHEQGGQPSTSTAAAPFALLALLAVGALALALAWWRRSKQLANAPGEAIELLAQSSLGGRVRAMWLRAGERDMVVAVTAQAVQVLATWPHTGGVGDGGDGDGNRPLPAAESAHSGAASQPCPLAASLHPCRPVVRTALRATRPSGSRCHPSSRRRREEELP